MHNLYKLSKRELKVEEQLLLGKSAKEIGAALDLTTGSVYTASKNIYKKRHVDGRFDLMNRNFERKLKEARGTNDPVAG